MLQTLQDKKTHAIARFKDGCTWEETAIAIGTSRMSLWRWAAADPEFKAAIEEAKADPDAEVEAVTFANACDPDPAHNTLRMFWLKSRMPKRYKERFDLTSDDRGIQPIFQRIDNNRDQSIFAPTSPNGVCDH